MNGNINIILKQFKRDLLSEEETIQLIEGLYCKPYITYPYYPQITYSSRELYPGKVEVTCSI